MQGTIRHSVLAAISAIVLMLSTSRAPCAAPDPGDSASILGKKAPKAINWANKKTKTDKDADGIPDALELSPFNFGGIPITLNPNRKDVILLIDSVGANNINKPTDASLAIIIQAFDNAPVKGFKRELGVALHVVVVDTGAPYDSGSTVGDFVDSEYDWSDLDTVKAYTLSTYSLQSVPNIYHYCLSCDNIGGTSISGISRNSTATYATFRSGGVDLICSLSGYQSETDYAGVTGGTIMHELGHNLGLTHGGYDHVGYKPNYLSVMNYHFQFYGIRDSAGTTGNYDYSRYLLSPINEWAIKEKAGLGKNAAGYGTQFKFYGYNTTFVLTGDLRKNVDWDFGGFIDKQPYAMNLNYPNDLALTWLVSEANWANLNFTGGGHIQADAVVQGQDEAAAPAVPRFTKVPADLACQEFTDADAAEVAASPHVASVADALAPGSRLVTAKGNGLTLYEITQE